MVSNDDVYRYKNVLKNKIAFVFRIYLSIAICLSPIFLMNQANAAIGGWTLGNPVAQGASAVYDATKTVLINGKDVIKNSSVKITPTAANVAKVLARTGVTLALSVAVEQLLGSVDWVLDAENNQIKYLDPAAPGPYLYGVSSAFYATSPQASCALQDAANAGSWVGKITYDPTKGEFGSCVGENYPQGWTLYRVANPAYDPTAEENYKTLPLSTVAAQVISNAESDTDKKVAAQSVTMTAAQDIVNEAESDETKARPIATELDKAASTATDEAATGTATQTKTDPTTGEPTTETTDISLEFPAFCGWAPTVCEAAQTVISFPTTLTNWWDTAVVSMSEAYELAKSKVEEATEYFSEEPTSKEDSDFEIEEPEFEADDVTLTASNECPQDSVNFSLLGNSYTFEMPYQPVCDALSFFKPAVLAVGAITSAFIMTGIRTKEEEA